MYQALILSAAACLGQADSADQTSARAQNALLPAPVKTQLAPAPIKTQLAPAPVRTQLLPPPNSRLIKGEPVALPMPNDAPKAADTKDDADKKEDGNGCCEEKKEEEPAEPGCLMKAIECNCPNLYQFLECRKTKIYGWVQAGVAGNVDSPHDRINFGTNFNWRSNDFRLNQVYFVVEKALEHEKEANIGYRVDFYTGHNTPFQVANGFLSNFTGFDPTSGYGVEGPSSFRRLDRIGIDLPQFYVNAHIPGLITEKGVDVLVGKFWTLLGHEVYPAPQMEFYSMSYEIIYGTPFTHTGTLGTVHATDNWDVTAGIVIGSDVFVDNNDKPSFTGNFVWNSTDKRVNWTTAWITGPEQFNNNDNYRTVVTSCVTALFGADNKWKFVFGGNLGLEDKIAVDPLTGAANDAEWYGLSSYLFYTVDSKLTLGTRAEWFRDDDGVRTAVTGRPGFADNFYEVTLGASYNLRKNLRLRPEVRFDWTDHSRAFNDQTDKFQTTLAMDLIWQY